MKPTMTMEERTIWQNEQGQEKANEFGRKLRIMCAEAGFENMMVSALDPSGCFYLDGQGDYELMKHILLEQTLWLERNKDKFKADNGLV